MYELAPFDTLLYQTESICFNYEKKLCCSDFQAFGTCSWQKLNFQMKWVSANCKCQKLSKYELSKMKTENDNKK